MPGMERYTVDELARVAGLPTSTIRLYRQRGLIQPPERDGRRAYYGPEQLAELELIARLKGRGYSLAAIQEMLELWRGGGSLEVILEPQPVDLDLSELFAVLFPDGVVDPALVARAAGLGLLEMGPDGVQLRDPRDLEVGAALIRMGVPPGIVLDEYEHLQRITDDLAARFADLFEEHVLPIADQPGAQLDELVRLARQVVELALLRSLRREGERRLAG